MSRHFQTHFQPPFTGLKAQKTMNTGIWRSVNVSGGDTNYSFTVTISNMQLAWLMQTIFAVHPDPVHSLGTLYDVFSSHWFFGPVSTCPILGYLGNAAPWTIMKPCKQTKQLLSRSSPGSLPADSGRVSGALFKTEGQDDEVKHRWSCSVWWGVSIVEADTREHHCTHRLIKYMLKCWKGLCNHF